MKRLVVLLVALCAALPLPAQLGYTGPEGLRLRVRTLGGKWEKEISTGWDRLQGGQVGSGRAIDGIEIRNMKVPLRLQVRVGKRWLPWAEPGVGTGVPGSAITGLRLKAERRGVRYRASFVGKGVTDWASDEDALEAGGAALEAIEVDLLDAAPKNSASFEYRVLFSGSGFTPWLKAGEVAEGTGPGSYVSAVELRGGGGLRTEVRMDGQGWEATFMENEVAGDPDGKRALTSIRIHTSGVPLRYRLKVQGSEWGPWQPGPGELSSGAGGARIEGIQLDLKRAGP